MKIIEVKNKDADELRMFTSLTETQLRMATEFEEGIFIAESPKVIKVALENKYSPIAILCEKKHISGDAAQILSMCPDIPVYTGEREILTNITGYKLTRGVLCAMQRKPEIPLSDITKDASLIAVLHGICDTTNIGAIFRSASALGVDAVVLSKDSCDPLNRRSIRVSMGAVFTIPWAIVREPVKELQELNYKTVAFALRNNSVAIDNQVLRNEGRLAVVLGTEGEGLPEYIIEQSDFVVKIPMYHKVDSLNVGAAAAIAFWELKKYR